MAHLYTSINSFNDNNKGWMDMSTNVESGKAATKSFDDRDVGKTKKTNKKKP